MTLMFDSPLKKLTESEAVIAELVVEDILAWLHEQKLPLYVALNKWHASIASKDARWDVALRFSGTLVHYTGICDSTLDMRISSVMLFLFADAAKKYELSQVGSDALPVAVKSRDTDER